MPQIHDLSDEALLAEWHVWNDKVRTATSWGAALGAADGFRKGCETEMHKRGIPVPPSPVTKEVSGDASVFEAEPGSSQAPSVDGLIEQLGAAREGNDRLDDLVRRAIGNGWPDPSKYTQSLDDALMLMPDSSYLHSIIRDPEGEFCPQIAVRGTSPTCNDYSCSHNDLRLALCIAALRARQSSPPDIGSTPGETSDG